jgi:hypothetical protein
MGFSPRALPRHKILKSLTVSKIFSNQQFCENEYAPSVKRRLQFGGHRTLLPSAIALLLATALPLKSDVHPTIRRQFESIATQLPCFIPGDYRLDSGFLKQLGQYPLFQDKYSEDALAHLGIALWQELGRARRISWLIGTMTNS